MRQAVTRLGGAVRRADLVEVCGRAAVDAALRDRSLVTLTRGTYGLADAEDRAVLAAASLSGVLSHRSAALAWGWAVRAEPALPEVTVAKGRRIAPARRSEVVLHRTDLHPDDVVDGRTSRERTLVDCLRTLPFPDALAVADSALRSGMSVSHLAAVARDVRGPGGPRVRRVAACADGRAANPFESSLRAVCLTVDGLDVTPQVDVHEGRAWLGRPDLVDERLRIVLEADSFEWHGDRAALRRDARRYNALVAAGWLVLRFTWEDVVLGPAQVAAVLRDVVARRTDVLCVTCRAA